MSTQAVDAPAVPPTEQKPNDKEFNFRQLEAKYNKELQKEREYRAELEGKLQTLMANQTKHEEDSDDSEPYVDNKKLEKKLSRLNQSTQTEIQKAMEAAKNATKEEIKKELWLEAHDDFIDVLKHADKFAEANPQLADSILSMPDTFERKKLVYSNIKALGLDKPKPKESSIQSQIDNNRRAMYYQPTGIANAPFTPQGDFSESGQKAAYQKMQESKKKMRLG